MLKNNPNIGRNTTDVRKQLLIVIWILATPDSFRSVGDRFDVGKSLVSDLFARVVKALNKIAQNVVHWPREEEKEGIKNAFCRMAGIPNVIRAIDGTYINSP